MNEHQEFESSWWGPCLTIYGEETKQLVYAQKMGISTVQIDGQWPIIQRPGMSILDIGGGPASLLLKTRGFTKATLVDPCTYPYWVSVRYQEAGISVIKEPAETAILDNDFDECWIYNVLQHVVDPQAIIEKARKAATILRIFEWIDVPEHLGHPHMLTQANLETWIGHPGKVQQINEGGCVGKAFYGVFA